MKLKELAKQFVRYVLVGGIAFLADFLTLSIVHRLLLPKGSQGLYAGVAAGFLVGSVVNYLLSHKFVFSGMNSKAQNNLSEFFQYVLIGLCGLGISELGMYIGTELLKLYFGIVKVFVAGIVLVWNFAARRFLLYK